MLGEMTRQIFSIRKRNLGVFLFSMFKLSPCDADYPYGYVIYWGMEHGFRAKQSGKRRPKVQMLEDSSHHFRMWCFVRGIFQHRASRLWVVDAWTYRDD